MNVVPQEAQVDVVMACRLTVDPATFLHGCTRDDRWTIGSAGHTGPRYVGPHAPVRRYEQARRNIQAGRLDARTSRTWQAGWTSGQSDLGGQQTAAEEFLRVQPGRAAVDHELGGISLEVEADDELAPVAAVLAQPRRLTDEMLVAVATRAATPRRHIGEGGGSGACGFVHG